MEQQVFCRTFYIEREIHFPVRECTFYEDRRLASKEDMEKIARVLVTKSVGRSIGFVNPERFREIEAAAPRAPGWDLYWKEAARIGP
jgi:hypothetical protein